MSEKPICHLVWLQGRRAADDVEDYYEVARPGDKCVDGSDPFPVYAKPFSVCVPEGWQLVPKIPTVEMECAPDHEDCATPDIARAAYTAMLSAAPPSPLDIVTVTIIPSAPSSYCGCMDGPNDPDPECPVCKGLGYANTALSTPTSQP